MSTAREKQRQREQVFSDPPYPEKAGRPKAPTKDEIISSSEPRAGEVGLLSTDAEDMSRAFHAGIDFLWEGTDRARAAQTRLERQRQREQVDVEKQAKTKGKKLPGPPRPDLDARLANVARYVEPILAQNSRMVETYRFVSLVDTMAGNKLIPRELQAAADTFKELYLTVAGPSQGVGSYGEYAQASPPSQRMLTTNDRMEARKRFMAAFRAAFGVETSEGRWVIDQQLMKLVLPAILNDGKELSQADIGRARTRYSGRAQCGAAGGVVILEALTRLCLHFGYRVE